MPWREVRYNLGIRWLKQLRCEMHKNEGIKRKTYRTIQGNGPWYPSSQAHSQQRWYRNSTPKTLEGFHNSIFTILTPMVRAVVALQPKWRLAPLLRPTPERSWWVKMRFGGVRIVGGLWSLPGLPMRQMRPALGVGGLLYLVIVLPYRIVICTLHMLRCFKSITIQVTWTNIFTAVHFSYFSIIIPMLVFSSQL